MELTARWFEAFENSFNFADEYEHSNPVRPSPAHVLLLKMLMDKGYTDFGAKLMCLTSSKSTFTTTLSKRSWS